VPAERGARLRQSEVGYEVRFDRKVSTPSVKNRIPSSRR